jgi:hypothetical protein
MEQLRLHWEPIWSWPVVGLVTVVAALTVWLGYRMAAGLPRGRRQLLLGVRMATLLVLVIAMIRPQLQWISPEGDQPRVWVVGDASRSMSVLDGPGGISRRQAFLQLLESLDSPLTQLGREVELEQYDFAEKPVVQQEWSDAAEGQQTALGELLREVSRSHAQRPIASVFLFSDGAQRALPPFDLDPREAARELGELGIAVYPVPIGQAVSTADAADVAVDEIQVDPVVFVKKRVPVRVSVRWTGAGGQKLRVRLMLEDRSGLRMEQVGPLKPIPRSEFSAPELEFEPRYPNGSQVFELSFTPELSGEYKLAAQVEPIPGGSANTE